MAQFHRKRNYTANARLNTVAAKKEPKKMASKEEKVVILPLKDVIADLDWNSRSGDISLESQVDGAETKNESKTNSFKELVDSIRASGGINKDACKVRPKGNTGKMGLVSGFRRYAAIKSIAESDGNKEPVIKCIVEELDELQARIENGRENIARSALKGADLAWLLGETEKQYKAKKVDVSDIMITTALGLNQSYGNKLLNIVRKVPADVFAKWRTSELPLTVPEMVQVSKLGPDANLMRKGYEEMVGKKEPKKGKDKTKAYLDGLKAKATKLAYLLGTLEREGLINTDAFTFEDHTGWLLSPNNPDKAFKQGSTPKQMESVALAAEKAYNDAMKAVPQEDEEDAA